MDEDGGRREREIVGCGWINICVIARVRTIGWVQRWRNGRVLLSKKGVTLRPVLEEGRKD